MDDVQFESEAATPQGSLPSGSYAHALFALKYDQGVAENVLARVAKTDLRKFLGSDVKIQIEDGDRSPLWVEQRTVILDNSCIPETQPKDDDVTPAGVELGDLVLRLAQSIKGAAGSKTVLLLDALRVRVQEVSPGRYSFSVKQKWSIDVG